MNATKQWRCDHCAELFDDSDGAAKCCPPMITMVFTCGGCNQQYLDENDAETCCPEAAQEKAG